MDAEAVGTTGAVGSGVHRRYQLFGYAYFAVLAVATLFIVWTFGPLAALVLVLPVHLLLHAPILATHSETEMVTEDPAEAVYEELSSPRNPLTALWNVGADHVEYLDDRRVEFTVSVLLGLSEQRYVIGVDGRPGGTIRIEIQRGGSIHVDARVAIEETDDGTTVTVLSDRSGLHAFSLLLMWTTQPEIARHLSDSGYELVEEGTTVRLRSPLSG